MEWLAAVIVFVSLAAMEKSRDRKIRKPLMDALDHRVTCLEVRKKTDKSARLVCRRRKG